MPQPRTLNTNSDQQALSLSQRLNKPLLSYVAAAGAAGVSMLALTPSAEAKVVYTPANRTIISGSRLDLNNDGTPDFVFHGPFAICGTCSYFSVVANKTNKMMSNAEPLSYGKSVGGPSHKFRGGRGNMLDFCTCSGNSGAGGPWLGVQNGYMGFEFNIKGQPHFGWARFSVTDKGEITLTGYAYESVAHKPIVTGDTGGDAIDQQGSSAPPKEPITGLGHLALGAIGKSRQ